METRTDIWSVRCRALSHIGWRSPDGVDVHHQYVQFLLVFSEFSLVYIRVIALFVIICVSKSQSCDRLVCSVNFTDEIWPVFFFLPCKVESFWMKCNVYCLTEKHLWKVFNLQSEKNCSRKHMTPVCQVFLHLSCSRIKVAFYARVLFINDILLTRWVI